MLLVHEADRAEPRLHCNSIKRFFAFLIVELGSGCGEDVLVGRVLVQVKGFLFFQDQETEESGRGVRASASFAECLQAERGVSVALALLHKHVHTREFNFPTSSLILPWPPHL